MAKPIIMPKFGFTQEESTIVQWLKKEGDRVEKGDPIVEVTTDKINMEVEAPADGILGGIRYQEGETVPVTEVIAYILAEGEEAPEPEEKVAAAAPPAPAAKEAPPVAERRAVSATPVAQRIAEAKGVDLSAVPGSGPGGKITREDVERYLAERGAPPEDGKRRATPAARRVAREHGIDLSTVPGSGPRGRVQEADVLAAVERLAVEAPAPPPAPAGISAGPVVIPLEGMRKTIAERMQTSAQQAPHIMFTLDVDMSEAIAFREYANQRIAEGQPRISMTAVLVKACAWALRQHPMVNSHFDGERILVQNEVNIGVAVALEEGLIVPVVHQADQKGLMQIGAEVADLARRAREGRLRPDDLTGGTFTISNLGMFGVDHFTAIINPPEVAILAVGRIAKRFVPDENDQPVARPMMTITLSADHRVLDGAMAAGFLATLRQALEMPSTILL